MSRDLWTKVDHYLVETLLKPDPDLEAALKANAAANLPAMDVAANQGMFLHLLARIQGAKRILEIGTLGGYSTLWLAKALPPHGSLITLEFDPHHADTARANIDHAGMSSIVEVRTGPAIESLPRLHSEGQPPFDLIFIDADKPSYSEYLEWSLRLSRPGTVIIADNVIRNGAVADPTSEDPRVQGVRRFLAQITGDPRLSATALQTVGNKGYDGFTLAVVNAL
ncbi:O-methyltransferase [Granulicella sibirica]|uniref:O-methyltransferase n=1 Tax=Granulicella sibirica TaxID=2479048 RepID=A0A4V1L5Y6_9BACT|nr:O-methyltransferase [Granulicella sibirica]RXH57394.1 O-methyltransferase [Granulicella sibirica]